MPGTVPGDERGASLSALIATVMSAIFLTAGLVVDGSAQVQAHRRAEVAAARAVRQGSDATAARRLLGQDGTAEGLSAARAVLADEGVQGEVLVEQGRITARTHASAPTTFLSLLGIDALPATGSASAELRRP
ncbi:hypothetical protein GCM10027030_20590 [Luteococcus sediminum]